MNKLSFPREGSYKLSARETSRVAPVSPMGKVEVPEVANSEELESYESSTSHQQLRIFHQSPAHNSRFGRPFGGWLPSDPRLGQQEANPEDGCPGLKTASRAYLQTGRGKSGRNQHRR